MNVPKFTVNRCSKNPKRWNVYFDTSKPFNLRTIQQLLEKKQYQVLATTPSVSVFRSKKARLTWHTQGFIQVDLYDPSIQNSKDIKHLIKDILVLDTKDIFR